MPVLTWYEFAIRLGAATLLGGAIGVERERSTGPQRAAGLRTMALVALGSCLMMLVSAYGFTAFTGASYAKVDPSRIAAQVVSGIGFLGAGAILLRKNVVRGLTTAAAVWVVAGLGLACGVGFYLPALIATAFGLIVLEALLPLERRLFPLRGDYPLRILLAPETAPGDVIASIYATLGRNQTVLVGLELRPGRRGEVLELRCRARSRQNFVQALAELRSLPGIAAVRGELRSISDRATPAT
jgi:putative Mg2+ transporter-C (MgtC) family protein